MSPCPGIELGTPGYQEDVVIITSSWCLLKEQIVLILAEFIVQIIKRICTFCEINHFLFMNYNSESISPSTDNSVYIYLPGDSATINSHFKGNL